MFKIFVKKLVDYILIRSLIALFFPKTFFINHKFKIFWSNKNSLIFKLIFLTRSALLFRSSYTCNIIDMSQIYRTFFYFKFYFFYKVNQPLPYFNYNRLSILKYSDDNLVITSFSKEILIGCHKGKVK